MTILAHITHLYRLLRGPRWRPLTDLGPDDQICMVHHATYGMWFAEITGPDHYPWPAVIWGHGRSELFIVIDPPSTSKIIDAAYRARLLAEMNPCHGVVSKSPPGPRSGGFPNERDLDLAIAATRKMLNYGKSHDHNPGINDDPMAAAREVYLQQRNTIEIPDVTSGSIQLSVASGVVLTITPDGKLVRGEGFASDDAASVAFFDVLSKYLPCFVTELRARAERAEAEAAWLKRDNFKEDTGR